MPPGLGASQNPTCSSALGNLPATEEQMLTKQSNQQPDNLHKQNRKQSKTHQEIKNDKDSPNGSFVENFKSVAEMQKAFKQKISEHK